MNAIATQMKVVTVQKHVIGIMLMNDIFVLLSDVMVIGNVGMAKNASRNVA